MGVAGCEYRESSDVQLDVSFEYEYMYLEHTVPQQQQHSGLTAEELRFAAVLLFLMTPGVQTLI
eukprot:3785555-Pleurochrysis_carterae.AAC.1